MPNRKTPEPTIKIHKRFNRTTYTHPLDGDGEYTDTPVGHYTIAGIEGSWRLIRNDAVDEGKRSINYFVDRVWASGEWDEVGWASESRRPALAKVRALILKSLEEAPPKKAPLKKVSWAGLTLAQKKERIRRMLLGKGLAPKRS